MRKRFGLYLSLVLLGLMLLIPSGCVYYFPWYDFLSPEMKGNWVLMATPATYTAGTTATVWIAGIKKGTYRLNPGQITTPQYPGVMDGPVAIDAVSTNLQPLITSQRVIFKDTFSEVLGLQDPQGPPWNLSETKYWFTWYDLKAANNMKGNWILVGNASTNTAANVNIKVGTSVNANYTIPIGGRITPYYPEVMDGPVTVECTNGEPIYCTQRVIYKDSFSETWGIPDYDLNTGFQFTWYDEQSPGMKNWILVGADSANASNANVEIWIGGVYQGWWPIAPGSRITPHFPGVMNGPVEVRCTNGQAIFASQRVLYGDSFEEISGNNGRYTSQVQYFTWYDQQSPGMKDWILVANTSQTASTNVSIEIGPNSWTYPLGPGARITPSFPGYMGGLVKVTSDVTPVYASQRVLYKNSFNEVWGIVELDFGTGAFPGTHP